MAKSDQERWEKRYRERNFGTSPQPSRFLLDHQDLLPARGLALDFAMGLGANSAVLLARGMQVIGMDISFTAVKLALARYPQLMGVVCDLEQYPLPKRRFAAVLNFFYLDRNSWPMLVESLKPGGILVIETFQAAWDKPGTDPGINPEYLLSPGELKYEFSRLETLVYEERTVEMGNGKPGIAAGLVAQKPERF
ncbi:MAG: class I SAM-dependent methyltransferase [Anaerolineales bacterium]|nr:class I SAM-dependent methyltransferase [Anaerolineales bacterium]